MYQVNGTSFYDIFVLLNVSFVYSLWFLLPYTDFNVVWIKELLDNKNNIWICYSTNFFTTVAVSVPKTEVPSINFYNKTNLYRSILFNIIKMCMLFFSSKKWNGCYRVNKFTYHKLLHSYTKAQHSR